MKKKIWIPIIVLVALLVILFVPVPKGTCNDGGTREWVALTYRIVDWNRIIVSENGESSFYEKTRFYGPADKNKSIDELWERESAKFGKRGMEYTEQWIDKAVAEKYDNSMFDHIVITEIYSNCFFARTVIPMPYTIKLNGKLSDKWCVGDQVICTYENTYYDSENNRIEVDFLTVEESDWKPDPFVAYKPVIYLYPEKETEVDVKLTLDGNLTCTYPAYNDGWKVTASCDGTLTDESGKEYNYLYWEGETYAQYDFSRGFCVKGEDTAKFLEDTLERLGLTRREANEFIVFWLPMMQENEYNIISFQTDAYTNSARLEVAPAPDTLIRVFMAYKPSDKYVEIAPQELSAPERRGFTVIEWGGTEIK